ARQLTVSLRDQQDSDDFSEHSSVTPELTFIIEGLPDGCAGADLDAETVYPESIADCRISSSY
uniref:hypothetical protein n=1 Tax=uncultured Rubinisphaera sp. TaxID=1678686 RepID=UPI0030DC2946